MCDAKLASNITFQNKRRGERCPDTGGEYWIKCSDEKLHPFCWVHAAAIQAGMNKTRRGLLMSQGLTLLAVAARCDPGCYTTRKDVADELGIPLSTSNYRLKTLIRDGYVELVRGRGSQPDIVRLTEKGASRMPLPKNGTVRAKPRRWGRQ